MLKTNSNVIITNEKINSNTDSVLNSYQKLDDHNIYKVLHECNKDMGKYRQYVYYIGTSNDNRKLRLKLQKLQDRIFKNLRSQRDSILSYTRNAQNSVKEKTKLENVICFTLTSLNYLEDLVDKLDYLLERFPLCNANELVINLGFEDSTINANEEGNSDNFESTLQNINVDEHIRTNRNHNNSNSIDIYDFADLKQRLKYLQSLRDEIEQFDVYQIRYNGSGGDSHEFIKNLNAYNEELKQISVDDDDSCIKTILRIKNCSRRKCLCAIVLTVVIVIVVVAIIIGIIYAFNK